VISTKEIELFQDDIPQDRIPEMTSQGAGEQLVSAQMSTSAAHNKGW
jgi:hypothetical protein